MKRTKLAKFALLFSCLVFANQASAITPEEDEKLKVCKKPKFREFVPEHKATVAAGTPISFHISKGADPFSVTAETKGQKISLTVRDRINFLTAVGNLPADLEDGWARLSISARAVEGGCLGQDGWLLNIGRPEAAAKPAEKP